MKRYQLLLNLALGLSLAGSFAAATPAASAQTTSRLQVRIPFSFSADKQPMPAGDYVVEIAREGLLSFRNVETGKLQTVMVRPDSWQANKGSSRLTFHREAGQTYLTQVWVQGRNLHSELLSHPKPQPEFAKLAQPASTFEIAMK